MSNAIELDDEIEMFRRNFRLVLSTCPDMTPSLCRLLVNRFLSKELNKNQREFAIGFFPTFNNYQVMNGVGGENDYHLRDEDRHPLHAELWRLNPRLAQSVHYQLYQIAVGMKHEELTVPRYLRTPVGMAYHSTFVKREVGLVFYEAALKLHRIDPNRDSQVFSGAGLTWLAGKFIAEQRLLGFLREDEPITSELLSIASTL